MSGVPDSQYVVARSVLLDALAALGKQRDAVIVVGAQAIYLDMVHIEFAIPEFIADADITIDPALMSEVARKARGLEAALVDKATITISALDPGDDRRFDVAVAGPAALSWRSCTSSPNVSPDGTSVVWTTRTLSTSGGCSRQATRRS